VIETALAVVRILTGVLLTVSAYGKFLQDYGAGVSDVLGYRIVRRPVAEAIAFALPVVEMLLAACLVLGLLLPASEVVAGVLLALLAGAAGSGAGMGRAPRVIHRVCIIRRFRVPFPPVSRVSSVGSGDRGRGRAARRWRREAGR